MVCLLEIKDKSATSLMWLFAALLAVGIIIYFMKVYGNGDNINKNIGPICLLVGFAGSMLIGIASGKKKREGFTALYGF